MKAKAFKARFESNQDPRKRWVIVGGGPVGCHLAVRLLQSKKARRDELAILDPTPLMSLWRTRTQNCGMRYLRSSCVHHLGAKPSDLSSFQKKKKWSRLSWRGKARCPSLELFNAHCLDLLKRWNLEELRIPVRADTVVPREQDFLISTGLGDLRSNSVVLALGPYHKKRVPQWLRPVEKKVLGILEPHFSPDEFEPGQRIAVLGGGMTAVQTALKLSKSHRVTLLTRSPIKVSEFDSHASWMGPMKGIFLKLNAEERLRAIARNRRPGTINEETFHEFRAARRSGSIQHQILGNPSIEASTRVVDEEWELETDLFLLGTGFTRQLHPVQQQLSKNHGAEVVDSAFPLLDRKLQWLPNLYVAGSGAELQLGPPAGNILGAKLAAKRILQESKAPSLSGRR